MTIKSQQALLIICTISLLASCASKPASPPKPKNQPIAYNQPKSKPKAEVKTEAKDNSAGVIAKNTQVSSQPKQAQPVSKPQIKAIRPPEKQTNASTPNATPKKPIKAVNTTATTIKSHKPTKTEAKLHTSTTPLSDGASKTPPIKNSAPSKVKKPPVKPKRSTSKPIPSAVEEPPITQDTEQQLALLDSSKAQQALLPVPEVNLEALPIVIASWIVDKPDDISGTHCLLRTPNAQIEDGVGGSPISLVISPNMILIPTKSNVDLSYDNSQLSLDSGISVALEAVQKETNVTIEKQYLTVINSLKAAKLATIEIGFWPSWPQTHTYKVDIPVTGFSTAYQAWQDCNKIL